MSLKNIGNILNAGTDINKLYKVVSEIGDITKAAEALNSVKGLSNDLKVSALAGSFDGVDAKAAKAALGIKETASAATGATSGISAFGAALKGVWASIAPFVLPAVGAIAAGLYVYSQSFSKAQKDLQ